MSTYGKLTVPTADIFKSQNKIASIDDSGKVPVSQLPIDTIKDSLSNTDLSVKSITVKSNDGAYNGKIFQNDLTTDIASQDGSSGIQLYSSANNKRVSALILGSTEGSIDGNIVLKSNKPTGYDIGEINISTSDGNYIKLGDGKFKLSSIDVESTNSGSEINLSKDNITVIGATTTTIANNVNGEQIIIGGGGITLDSKNVSSISLQNATDISLSSQLSLSLSSSQITLTGEDSSGIVLNGYNSKLSLTADNTSFTFGSSGQGLTFSAEDNLMYLYAGGGKPWLIFGSNGSIDMASEEGVGKIRIERSSFTQFQNNEFRFEPCFGTTNPVYIKVPVVDSATNKLDGTYARLYVTKDSSGNLTWKVEAAS